MEAGRALGAEGVGSLVSDEGSDEDLDQYERAGLVTGDPTPSPSPDGRGESVDVTPSPFLQGE